MRVAVLSLTRDRLDYTKHCFTNLDLLAGCAYDHFVRDQASTDGTQDWLHRNEQAFATVIYGEENIGVSRGMNQLLAATGYGYDVYVKFDNDCELLVDGTLREACELVHRDQNLIVSPHILGLNSPPPVDSETSQLGPRLGFVGQLGGIFMAIPAHVFGADGFRYDETNPIWGMDDVQLSHWFQNRGGVLAYLLDYPANHYETTDGQRARYPDYFARKDAEFAPDHS